MKPARLTNYIQDHGKLERQAADQVFHAQAFPETLFMIETGYVKRYQVTNSKERVIELIYGPGHIFPLSQLYKKLFSEEQNRSNLIYVYQAMTDVSICRISVDEVLEACENDPKLYLDLYYETGLRIKSNINRLASNALKDDYKKVAHQLVCLADEFGEKSISNSKEVIKIPVPLKPIDMAEQLNISVEVTQAVMDSLSRNKLLKIKDNIITLPDANLLRDIYL